MAYFDPNFQVTIQDTVIGGGPGLGVSLGTVTASATQTYTGTAGSQVNGTFRLPIFKVPTKIVGIRVYTVVAPGSGVTGVSAQFFNGTSALGAALALNTAQGFADVVLTALTTASNGVATGPSLLTNTNIELTMTNTATGTASGSSLGSYSVDFIWQNLFTAIS